MMRCAVLAAVLATASCAGSKDKPAESAATAGVPAAGAAGGATPDCPRTGHWSACQLRKRLDQAGLAPRDTTELADLPELGVTPNVIMLGNAGLAYYLFADTLARHKAAASLDTMKFIPQAKSLSMRNEATRIESDNALAILLSRNEHQRERVADAITAGPPQP